MAGGTRGVTPVCPGRPAVTPSLARSLALGVLVLLLGLGPSFPPPLAWAQGIQPLQGQNIDPVTAGVTNSSVPVYFSVSLEKLYEVDETGYTFSAIFTVVMTWNKDPRINATVNLINFLGSDASVGQNQTLQNCTKWATFTGGSTNPDCTTALQSWASQTGCGKPCFMGNGVACCDNIWIPGFTIANIIYLSQDRVFQDEVWLYGSTVGSLDGDWGAVYRVVRVQADFSNDFKFQKFPFDSQVLQFQVSPVPPANHHIVPSLYGNTILGTYGFVFQNDPRALKASTKPSVQIGGASFQTDQVTGWEFTPGNPMRFICNSDQSPPPGPPSPLPFPDDPQYYAYVHLRNNTGNPQPGLTCSVCVTINRISSYYIANDIIPVLVNALLAFTVVFARPTDLDIRLSTLVTLFLALVAVQFVIADQLPRTTYITSFSWLVLISYMLIVILILESLFVFYLSIVEEIYAKKKIAADRRTIRRKSRRALAGEKSEQGAVQEGGLFTDDGRPPPEEMEKLSEDGPGGEKGRGPGRKAFFKPFMYTEETVMRLVQDEDQAFHIATLVDNISLLLLGIGYIIGAVLVFTIIPGGSSQCSA